jgi:hypothetical protein
LTGASGAHACRVSTSQTPILHDRLPAALPAGTIAAEVEVITDIRAPGAGDRAMNTRVIRMMRGKYAGRTIRVAPTYISSCDGWPYPGTRGIVVGRVLSSSDGVLAVDPIRGPSVAQQQREAAERSRTNNP